MRASPYDFSAIGLRPIMIETAEGRVEYEAEQRRLSTLAEPIRARLIAELGRALRLTRGHEKGGPCGPPFSFHRPGAQRRSTIRSL
jgi:hypothetical protein